MDPAHVFRQGLGSVAPRQQQQQYQTLNVPRHPPIAHDDLSDQGDGSGRIAHTLTACCRCRQRKTRCDPTLPRCLPCERSGSICEYLDTAKGRKINRNYVIKLQDKVRALEAELAQYVDDDTDDQFNSEDMVRPGGMVRLGAADETPRYLGPSSGIAMTRLLMEEAKRYTQSNRISDLIPDLRLRRQNRMQSIQMTNSKNYPTTSEVPAEELPSRDTANRLVEVFKQKGQVFWPTLHEVEFGKDLDAVYNGDTDVFKRFVVNMVFAIGLQRMSIQYAGLADAFYLAAMRNFETILRPKDLKTLQCLVLVGQYSLITPTKVPVYYVIGLAAKICQQEGLVDEKTISTGLNLDPMAMDMRRRLVWTVASMEYGLAHSLGRPNSFATGDEQLDVGFFSTIEDQYVTENGIDLNGPISDRKVAAIHSFRMRSLQAEIRRTLYERKMPEPKNENSPWYKQMEGKMKNWMDQCPDNPPWCRTWFMSRYHQMLISMYRPSPQVSKPSPASAEICFKSAEYIIDLSRRQMDDGTVGITWVFLLVLNMSLNTLLWTISYPEVRQAHSKEAAEALINKALDVLDGCEGRWPGTGTSSELYSIFSKACLQSYESQGHQPHSVLTTPPAASETSASPDSTYAASVNGQQPMFNPPQFGYVFDSPPEAMNNYTMDPNFPPPQPSFRSNSIFQNPASHDNHGRRFSYFPPDFTNLDEAAGPEDTVAPSLKSETSMASNQDIFGQMPTPPDSMANMSSAASNVALSPPNVPLGQQAPNPMGVPQAISPPAKINPAQPQATQRIPPYNLQQNQPPPQRSAMPQQRPLPQQAPNATTQGDWFSPPAAFISPYNFGQMGSAVYNDLSNMNTFGDFSGSGLGLQGLGTGPSGNTQGFDPSRPLPGRQGSLTHSQQLELMNVLETEGAGDIDAFLKAGNIPDARWY